jgi:hypothetical protein
VYQIQTGVSEVQARDFQPPAQQGSQTKSGRHFAGPQHGLGAERRIVVHHQVFEIESRPRQQSQVNRADVHGTAQC